METSTSIKQMLAGNRIFVPSYQRAYSWDTEFEISKSPQEVNIFLSDLEAYNRSTSKSKYSFGHFLFEEKEVNKFGVIDGQQRITTIVIFLSALFSKLKKIRSLNESEQETFEDTIRRKQTYQFATVDYDNQIFKDYVIDQSPKDINGLETESAKRIVSAFDFFVLQLSNKDEAYLLKMLETIQNASCTTHLVKGESEAIQMFIFQNNRGKKPSNLEKIKAQIMFNVNHNGVEKKESLIDEIKSRFEKMYKSISSIESSINEDDVLVYTFRIHFNSLLESNAIEKINKLISEENSIYFIEDFTRSLAISFEHLTSFFGKDQRENLVIHSLISLGDIGISIPFIIKAYKFGLPLNDISQLCSCFESLLVRHKLIGTSADITSRLNDVYQNFNEDNSTITPIVERITWLKNVGTNSWGWSYWNNRAFERALNGAVNHSTAKFLLWKYENYLELQGRSVYALTRFDKITSHELEHIAPHTDNPEAGYDIYDEEFMQQYIDCLGNYILLSKSHNYSVGNKPFSEKRASYIHLLQQKEIQEMTSENPIWTRDLIQKRKEKIVQFIMTSL